MMKVLITGGAGFIGSHLVDRALEDGYQVRVVDNLSTGHLRNLPMGHPHLEFSQGDIRDEALINDLCKGIDVIVHLAAVASVQASVEDPVGTHQSNFDGTLNILEAARDNKVRRILYASSAAVYGDARTLPITENTALNPLTPYAIDKLSGEYYLAAYQRNYGIESLSLRFFNIYGPRQDASSPYSGVISIFADHILSGQPLTIYGDGKQTRDFVYVRDLIDILMIGLGLKQMRAEVVNVGSSRSISLHDLIHELEQLVGYPIGKNYGQAREGDIRHSQASISHLKTLIGYAPSTPVSSGLAKLLESVRIPRVVM
ncbi:MAG: NAD-dependent dehydratase [Gammaproteobacteria bacterium RBG_16_57_12]|nr:MAG: NAD-dependent dehydratase [Gammaproteobacteria bacterium RBG_16_57_12]